MRNREQYSNASCEVQIVRVSLCRRNEGLPYCSRFRLSTRQTIAPTASDLDEWKIRRVA